ncbi:MAG: sulfur oxidation c-type cytochrome SoxA [Hyphomicrobiales bacterium]|nr:sulfur oxidation c-type cytochrome SoxA [Hyphomicrobiales bacterium]MDE2114547.1 sulfur oxidation c-type cytochrome SoxA [Hyphomicrobiales bacterium]
MAFAMVPAAASADDAKPAATEAAYVPKGIPAPAGSVFKTLFSGYQFRSADTRAMQDDDFSNPGMLSVEAATSEWSHVDGEAGKSCASCHADPAKTMHGVGTHYPRWNKVLERPVTLEQQINLCRTNNMKAKPWAFNSENLTNMTTFVRYQSRGLPVAVKVDGPMSVWFDKGKSLYYQRIGQLDMACSNCHEKYYGKHIRADLLSQGQTNDFPTYRLKSQHLVPVEKRFQGCMAKVRAKPYKIFSDNMIALEVYTAWRGNGLPVETPGVRN